MTDARQGWWWPAAASRSARWTWRCSAPGATWRTCASGRASAAAWPCRPRRRARRRAGGSPPASGSRSAAGAAGARRWAWTAGAGRRCCGPGRRVGAAPALGARVRRARARRRWPAAARGPAAAQPALDKLSTFFVGRLQFGATRAGTAATSARTWSSSSPAPRPSTSRRRSSSSSPTPRLFETPFLFMNGHNDFVLSEAGARRTCAPTSSHGGFVMASGCCTNPEFPAAWRREFSRIFPGESVQKIPYDHLIYRSFYKLERILSANGNREVVPGGPVPPGRAGGGDGRGRASAAGSPWTTPATAARASCRRTRRRSPSTSRCTR